MDKQTTFPRKGFTPVLFATLWAMSLTSAPSAALGSHPVRVERQSDPDYDIVWARVAEADLEGESVLLVRARARKLDAVIYPSFEFSHSDGRGDLKGYAEVVSPTPLRPWTERTLSFVILSARVVRGDRLSLSQGRREPPTRSSCEAFCDMCFERAEAMCLNGLESYSCACSEGERHCNFVCSPPSP